VTSLLPNISSCTQTLGSPVPSYHGPSSEQSNQFIHIYCLRSVIVVDGETSALDTHASREWKEMDSFKDEVLVEFLSGTKRDEKLTQLQTTVHQTTPSRVDSFLGPSPSGPQRPPPSPIQGQTSPSPVASSRSTLLFLAESSPPAAPVRGQNTQLPLLFSVPQSSSPRPISPLSLSPSLVSCSLPPSFPHRRSSPPIPSISPPLAAHSLPLASTPLSDSFSSHPVPVRPRPRSWKSFPPMQKPLRPPRRDPSPVMRAMLEEESLDYLGQISSLPSPLMPPLSLPDQEPGKAMFGEFKMKPGGYELLSSPRISSQGLPPAALFHAKIMLEDLQSPLEDNMPLSSLALLSTPPLSVPPLSPDSELSPTSLKLSSEETGGIWSDSD
jgi:hypothetical protein